MEEGMGSARNQIAKSITKRIIAVFIASGLSVLGAGAIVGVDIASAVLMAGILGVASVVEKIARSFIDDGKLTMEEVNAAFNNSNTTDH
jgi:hypothetical protein|tara:strand:- start:1604 stop:1870 length:267 start_codon:yes stop_codon:yes gene_type:complete